MTLSEIEFAKKISVRSVFSFLLLGSAFLVAPIIASAAPISLILNWKAEPEFGGFYAAQVEGIYKRLGLEVSIVPGGVAAPTIAMLATNKVDFAISTAEEILTAQSHGVDAVALFATFQNSPVIFMTHKARGFKSIQDVFRAKGVLAARQAYPFFQFLQKKFGMPQARLVPYLGGIDHFISNPNYSQQAYATSEPLLATARGIPVDSFLVSQTGYNSYHTVLAARKEFIEANRHTVTLFLEAVREGWATYLAKPQRTNTYMHELNPAITLPIYEKAALAQKPYIQTVETTRSGRLGIMNKARWEILSEQLYKLALIHKIKDINQVFMNL